MPTLDERIEVLRRANAADGGWINDAELHRLGLALAAETERLLAENERLLGLIKAIVAAYDHANQMRTADFHHSDCICLRCMVDHARAALAKGDAQ